MRLMVLSTLYPPNLLGGAEKSVALIAEGLAWRGHEVSVLTLHDDPASTETMQEGVTVLRRPLRNLYWPYPADDRRGMPSRLLFHLMDTANLPMARIVCDAVRRYRPDIVLSNQLSGFSALAWQAVADAGARSLHSLRDFYLICARSKMFRSGRQCLSRCTECRVLATPRKYLSRHVDGVTGVSQYMIDRHRAAGLFPNALMLPSILSAVITPPQIAARAAAPPGKVRRFGYIGRVEREKGIDLLLDGLLTLPRSQWHLTIAGSAPEHYLAHLRQRCDGLPVTFLGFVPAEDFYKAVDVVVVPSIWEEPLPRTVLEAFGHGLTVIATRRGGIPEIVRANETGYLVDPDQPETMAAAVQRAVADPDEGRRFGLAGRQVVTARTQATVAEEYEAACSKILLSKASSPFLKKRTKKLFTS